MKSIEKNKKPLEFDEFSNGIELLEHVFMTTETPTETLHAYFDFLKHLTFQEFDTAVKNIIRQNDKFPTIAVFLRPNNHQHAALPNKNEYYSIEATAERMKKREEQHGS